MTGVEQFHPAIAAERNEVQAALILIADWLDVHSMLILVRAEGPPSRKKRGKG